MKRFCYRDLLTAFAIVLVSGLSRPSPALAEESCGRLLARPWRGVDCLHCLHPRSTGGAEPITQLLKETCLQKVMIAFVVDGSFGWNPNEIEQAVYELRQGGRDVWLHLYVYNGPAQRRWQTGIFNSFAVMDPQLFRSRLLRDPALQHAYRAIVRERVLPAASFAVSLGARVSIAPGLEDNLDDAAFNQSVRLIRREIPTSVPYTLVRSGCFRCGAGNGRSRPRGALLEEHDDLLFPRRWDGIINTDGRYFSFSAEKSTFPKLRDLVSSWLLRAGNQRNAFLLWVPHFQDTPPGLVPRPLDQRNFRGPTAEESKEIIEFLRG